MDLGGFNKHKGYIKRQIESSKEDDNPSTVNEKFCQMRGVIKAVLSQSNYSESQFAC